MEYYPTISGITVSLSYFRTFLTRAKVSRNFDRMESHKYCVKLKDLANIWLKRIKGIVREDPWAIGGICMLLISSVDK